MKYAKGFTLVELMVSITIGILVLTGATQFYLNVFRSNVDGVRLQRFEQTVHVLAETMVSDLRRAGYERPGVTLTPQANAEFFTAVGTPKCILFNYSNQDPTDNTWKQYWYGYQLSGQVIYFYESNLANGSCANLTGWEALTDVTQIIITNTDAQPVFAHAGAALVNINLRAQAVGVTAQGGGAVTRNLNVSVRVRNGS
jgi:prepilin peptidase dependent protein B